MAGGFLCVKNKKGNKKRNKKVARYIIIM